jgi:hypothetical protein
MTILMKEKLQDWGKTKQILFDGSDRSRLPAVIFAYSPPDTEASRGSSRTLHLKSVQQLDNPVA